MTYTPGPWDRELRFVVPHNVDANNFHGIAKVYGPDREANARLIAAAPDLLAALERTNDLIHYHLGDPTQEDGWKNEEIHEAWLAARTAIAKAKGHE